MSRLSKIGAAAGLTTTTTAVQVANHSDYMADTDQSNDYQDGYEEEGDVVEMIYDALLYWAGGGDDAGNCY